MSTPLTEKQAALVAYMREFLARNDDMPTILSITYHFGWASSNSAFEHLLALKKKGVIERNEQGGWRFVRAPSISASPSTLGAPSACPANSSN